MHRVRCANAPSLSSLALARPQVKWDVPAFPTASPCVRRLASGVALAEPESRASRPEPERHAAARPTHALYVMDHIPEHELHALYQWVRTQRVSRLRRACVFTRAHAG